MARNAHGHPSPKRPLLDTTRIFDQEITGRWVKYFFVPDLYYWRYDDRPQYEDIRAVTDDACRDADEDVAKQLQDVVKRLAFDHMLPTDNDDAFG